MKTFIFDVMLNGRFVCTLKLKAMRLTKKWKSRKIRNEANKMLKKNPLKPRDLQRSALRLMRYGCSKA